MEDVPVMTVDDACDKALSLLARREYSRFELLGRLQRKGCTEPVAIEALDRLREANYQSDERFADMLVRSRIGKGYGPRRLLMELRQHGFPDVRASDVVAEADVDWTELARAQVVSHFGDQPPGDFKARGKRMQYLLRRGFDMQSAREAVDASGH